MSTIMIIASLASSLLRFRGELIEDWLGKGLEVYAAAPGADIKEDLRKKGVTYFALALQRTGLNPFKDFQLFLQLVKIYQQVKPDYLFLYTIKPVIYGSIAAFIIPECKVFSMITGLGYIFTEDQASNWLRALVTWLYRFALKRSDQVFFQNPDDFKLFSNLSIVKPEKIVLVNGSGVNLDYYHKTVVPDGPPVFLLIARLLKEKGIAEYIEAAARVKKEHPEAVFRMICWQLEGGPSVISNAQVESWKQDGLVEIYGEVADVRPLLAEASVYVLPSYREGTPRTVLEAMAIGRAIITTDVPGCRETVEEGVNGYLVPLKDSKKLAEAMKRFILEPELIARMGAESRKIAEQKYDVHIVNKEINQAMGL